MTEYTVDDLLRSENLQELRLAAGSEGLHNRIGNVNVIDNADSYDWLHAGDFLLTTGFIYKDDPDQLVQMVDLLSKINCAGLGFKIRRYFDEIPKVMLRRADELGFPIVEIPFKYSLADISNEITRYLHNVEDSYFSQYLSIQNGFNECALNGGGIRALVETLYGFVHLPTLLVDSGWRFLAACDPEEKLSDLISQKLHFDQEFIDSIPNKVIGRTKVLTRTMNYHGEKIVTRIAQLDDSSSIYGFLLVFEMGRRMDMVDFVALESATIPILLERVKAKQISEVKHQLRQDFFDDLLQGRIESINAVRSLAEIHSMDINKTYMCMVTKLIRHKDDNSEDGRNNFLKIKNEMISLIDRAARRHEILTVSIYRSDLVISFINVPEKRRRLRSWEILDGMPEEVQEEAERLYPLTVRIGIGTPIDHFLDLKASYYQANEAIRHVGAEEGSGTGYFENYIVDQLINSVKDRDILNSFAEMSLGPLLKYDREHGTNLVQTLAVYFDCNGNVSIAAKKLFLHRNSLIYRMDRIKEVLNTDLRNPTELLTLQVGLRVLWVIENQ